MTSGSHKQMLLSHVVVCHLSEIINAPSGESNVLVTPILSIDTGPGVNLGQTPPS